MCLALKRIKSRVAALTLAAAATAVMYILSRLI